MNGVRLPQKITNVSGFTAFALTGTGDGWPG